jgi:hypothetical protein
MISPTVKGLRDQRRGVRSVDRCTAVSILTLLTERHGDDTVRRP